VGIVAGGATEVPTIDKIAAYLWRLNEIRDFIDTVYIPDVLAVAAAYRDHFEVGRGCGNYLAYGVFDMDGAEADLTKRARFLPGGTVSAADLKPNDLDATKIREEVRHSWYADSSGGRHPSQGETSPQPGKADAYSWLKAPRYAGQPYEVGPLARMVIAYVQGDAKVKALVDGTLAQLGAPIEALFSALGRHAARALEAKLVADALADWVLQLKPGEPVYADYELPDEAEGMGLADGPRGALGHWIAIKDRRIANYQCVVPTTWNASPRDDRDQPGPIEQALQGTKVRDEENPFELVRIVRSFDPCIACAVHLVTPKGRSLGEFRVF